MATRGDANSPEVHRLLSANDLPSPSHESCHGKRYMYILYVLCTCTCTGCVCKCIYTCALDGMTQPAEHLVRASRTLCSLTLAQA